MKLKVIPICYCLFRAGFVCAHPTLDDSVVYSLEPMGLMVIESFCFRMIYIENIFHRTLLPKWVRDQCGTSEPSQHTWASDAIYNSVVFYLFVRWIEDRVC